MKTRYVLHHTPRGKRDSKTRIELTPEQAAALLKNKMIRQTGNIPGEVDYHTSVNLHKIRAFMRSSELTPA